MILSHGNLAGRFTRNFTYVGNMHVGTPRFAAFMELFENRAAAVDKRSLISVCVTLLLSCNNMQDKDPICLRRSAVDHASQVHSCSFISWEKRRSKKQQQKIKLPGIQILLLSCWLQGKLSCEHNFINAGIQNTAIKFKLGHTTLTFTKMRD